MSTGGGRDVAAIGDEFSNPRSRERFIWRATAASTDGAYCEFDLHLGAGAKVTAAHIHPRQTESFSVVSGELVIRNGAARGRLRVDERATVAPGVTHAWGATGGSGAQVRVRLTPALDIEDFFERFCAIAANGGATRSGVPRNPLRLALLLDDHRAEWGFPAAWQRRLLPPVVGLLAAIARRLGVTPTGSPARGGADLVAVDRSTADEEIHRVATRLGDLHVRIVGEGPTAVLWPSMFVDSHTWDLLVPLLPPSRRYVLVDGPGLGRSDSLAIVADIDGAAGAALDLLAGLAIGEPVDWVGNAFGGHVGYKLGARPGALRSLVSLSAPGEPLPAALRRQVRVLLPVLRIAGPVRIVRSAVLHGLLTDRAVADATTRGIVTDSLRRPRRASLSRAVRSFILNRVDVTQEFGDITVPSLFVASDDRGDWAFADAERAAGLTPHATAVMVSGARTLIPLEQPAEVARLISDFWETLP